jgi:ABC transporter
MLAHNLDRPLVELKWGHRWILCTACQMGTKSPVLLAKPDQPHPVGFSDEGAAPAFAALPWSIMLPPPPPCLPQARVDAVMGELGLEHVASSQVGGSARVRGISGGERRRVSIAMEIVIDPALILLDEPTSGLDSYTALHLMQALKQVQARALSRCLSCLLDKQGRLVCPLRQSLGFPARL